MTNPKNCVRNGANNEPIRRRPRPDKLDQWGFITHYKKHHYKKNTSFLAGHTVESEVGRIVTSCPLRWPITKNRMCSPCTLVDIECMYKYPIQWCVLSRVGLQKRIKTWQFSLQHHSVSHVWFNTGYLCPFPHKADRWKCPKLDVRPWICQQGFQDCEHRYLMSWNENSWAVK